MPNIDVATEALENIADGLLVKLNNNIDALSAGDFGAALEQLQAKGTRHFVLDMERVHFVNSTGMGLMVKLTDGLQNAGGSMVLVKTHPKVKITFSQLGLDSFFKMFPSLKRGMEYLNERVQSSKAGTMSAAPAAPVAKPAAARPAPPPPVAPAPRRPMAAPPPPAAPAPRSAASAAPASRQPTAMRTANPAAGAAPAQPAAAPSRQGTQSIAASAMPPSRQGTQTLAAGANLLAIVVLPANAPHSNTMFTFIQAACTAAKVTAKRVDNDSPATMAEAAKAQFIIADFSADGPAGQPGAPSALAVKLAQAGRSVNPPKQVILLTQGTKESIPPVFAALPTVPYQASQPGALQLQQTLTRGLQQLASRMQPAR